MSVGGMTLAELIVVLEQQDPDTVLAEGFGNAHSYRGYYEDLAFEPKTNARVGDMLAEAKGAMDQVFHGYKGGEYTMSDYTTCWIAEYGHSGGEMIGPMVVKYMLSTEVPK